MELWIRSTARTNLLKARFLTIIKGEKFYGKDDWEFKGYTICNCNEQGYYELLGTYKTEETALKVLDEIQKIIGWLQQDMKYVTIGDCKNLEGSFDNYIYEMPIE